MTNVAGLTKHYEACSEGPRLHKSRVRRLELETTLHVLHRHVPPHARVLELGAGHGAYALHFAERGHSVLATDLVDANVAAIRARAEREGLHAVQVRRADATCLDELAAASFEAVLCLGPYYHLPTRELRRRCLLECRRMVGEHGVVAVSYISRAFAVPYLLGTGAVPTHEHYEALHRIDHPRDDYPDEFFGLAHFSLPESVEAEVGSCGLEVVEHAGTDGIYGFFPEALERLDEAAYASFRAFHLDTCSSPVQRAVSPHCLVILAPR